MQISSLARRLLHLVFALSSSPQSLTRPRLERRLGVQASELTPALEELSRRGLLDSQRLRLTLSGLALAVASRASSASTARPPAGRFQPPVALFSQRESARAVA